VLGGKSIKALKERDEDERNITGRIADSEYPFMDEIFKGNDTLRSPLLGIINEGLYTNGTQVVNCPLRTLFAASNELPKPNDAFLASFAYRLFVVTIKSRKNFLKFVHQVREKDAPDTASVGLTVAELDAAHEDMKKVRWETEADDTFWQIREAFRKEGLMFNDRTAGWIASKVVPARAWRRGSDIVEAEDFAVLEHCLWNTPKDIPEVKKIIYKISNPVLEEARKAIDSATEAFQNAVNLARQNSDNREQAFGDANKKLNKEVERLDRRLKETQGKAHELLADAKSQVVEIAVKSAMEHGNVPRSVLQTMMEKEMV
jgi:MoxR-like ATPase